ncbi:hypothetical protein DFH08DRAFT_1088320 [Mycena albidolilacea]|uniref:Uncharacterized protein n=1 Tax=Mycena albidolilacea TaxID=1033008 RepID=A0AAD6Z681_9AGAR|nr:hypothetical protein DFH08DRAFT_1088320 [Mycena albidolilacea]
MSKPDSIRASPSLHLFPLLILRLATLDASHTQQSPVAFLFPLFPPFENTLSYLSPGSTAEGNPGRKGRGEDGRGRSDAGTPVYSHRLPYTRRLRTSAIMGRRLGIVTGAPKNDHGMEWASAAPDWCFEIASWRCEGRRRAAGCCASEAFHAFRSGAHAQRGAHGEPMCVVAIADDEGAQRGCGGLMITSGTLEVHHTLLELDSDYWHVEDATLLLLSLKIGF